MSVMQMLKGVGKAEDVALDKGMTVRFNWRKFVKVYLHAKTKQEVLDTFELTETKLNSYVQTLKKNGIDLRAKKRFGKNRLLQGESVATLKAIVGRIKPKY